MGGGNDQYTSAPLTIDDLPSFIRDRMMEGPAEVEPDMSPVSAPTDLGDPFSGIDPRYVGMMEPTGYGFDRSMFRTGPPPTFGTRSSAPSPAPSPSPDQSRGSSGLTLSDIARNTREQQGRMPWLNGGSSGGHPGGR